MNRKQTLEFKLSDFSYDSDEIYDSNPGLQEIIPETYTPDLIYQLRQTKNNLPYMPLKLQNNMWSHIMDKVLSNTESSHNNKIFRKKTVFFPQKIIISPKAQKTSIHKIRSQSLSKDIILLPQRSDFKFMSLVLQIPSNPKIQTQIIDKNSIYRRKSCDNLLFGFLNKKEKNLQQIVEIAMHRKIRLVNILLGGLGSSFNKQCKFLQTMMFVKDRLISIKQTQANRPKQQQNKSQSSSFISFNQTLNRPPMIQKKMKNFQLDAKRNSLCVNQQTQLYKCAESSRNQRSVNRATLNTKYFLNQMKQNILKKDKSITKLLQNSLSTNQTSMNLRLPIINCQYRIKTEGDKDLYLKYSTDRILNVSKQSPKNSPINSPKNPYQNVQQFNDIVKKTKKMFIKSQSSKVSTGDFQQLLLLRNITKVKNIEIAKAYFSRRKVVS